MLQGFDKNKRKAFALSLFFHLMVIVALFFLALRTPLPLPGEEGVEVDLGYSDQGVGRQQSSEPFQQMLTPQAVSSQEQVQQHEHISTSDEEAPAIVEKPIENPVKTPTESPPSKPDSEPFEASQQTINKRALYKAPANSNNSGNSEGITNQPGDQGKPDGLRDLKRYDGRGGQGNGPSFNLGGRGSKNLIVPKSNFREQGNVVVDIWVDRRGKVVRAEVSLKGTTVVDSNLREIAVQAALSSLFAEDRSAAPLQKGTITYTFIIGN